MSPTPASPPGAPGIQEEPQGAERTVRTHVPSSIGGAPVSYVVMLASVVAVLSFIPFSLAFASGGSFPMAQGVYPLTGWLLGPVAGMTASGLGALAGVFLAPHTAGIPWITVGGAVLGAGFASCIVARGRRALGLAASLLGVGVLVAYFQQATEGYGVRPGVFLAAYVSHLGALTLFVLPTRRWIGRLIASPDLRRVWFGLFLGTWSATGIMMLCESFTAYSLLHWPSQLFLVFAGIVPVEEAARSTIGAVVGTGVIAGLRALSLMRPPGARY